MKEMTKAQEKAFDEIMNADALKVMREFNGNLVIRTGGKRAFITIESLEKAGDWYREKTRKEFHPRIMDLVRFCTEHGEDDPNGNTGLSFTFVARSMTEEEAFEN